VGTERRFTLLFVCSFILLSALGAATRHASHHAIAITAVDTIQHLAAPAVNAPTTIDPLPAPLAGDDQSVLARVWSTDLSARFLTLLPAAQSPIVGNKQIISYYGNPYTPDMGVLGTASLETIASELEAQAARYDQLNGDRGVIPAIHLVYAVAQYHPTGNGLYLQYVSDKDVRRYLDLTERHGMLLFLDLQIGKSSVAAEIRKALPYLRYPQVHLALDPEFAVSGAEVPGSDLGSLRAEDIDGAQALLQQLADEYRLPPKILIVHQFADSMLQDADGIRAYDNVELVFDMDGFGPAAIKRAAYEQLAAQPYAVHTGIKLFFQHDPDMMSEEDVLRLQPIPTVVIYQ
jgi:hypothetical protein